MLCGVAAVCMMLSAACGGATNASSSASANTKPIKIGAVLEFTGSGAIYGAGAKDGIELALDQVNHQVAGRPIVMTYADDATDPAKAVEKTKALVDQGNAELVIAPTFTDAHMAMAPYLAQKHIMAIAMYGGSLDVAKFGNWIIFPGTNAMSGAVMGGYAYSEGYRTMDTLSFDYASGKEHVAGFADTFKAAGGHVVQQQWVPFGTTDYAPYVSAFKKADVICIHLFQPDLDAFLKSYLELGVRTPLMMDEIENLSANDLKEFGVRLNGVKGCIRMYSDTIQNASNKAFVAAFKTKYGRSPINNDAVGYIAMSIYLAALKATNGNTSLEAMRSAVAQLNLETPSGPVSFSPHLVTDSTRYMAQIKKVDGVYEIVPFKTYTEVRDPADK